jgi:glucuronosyltransferase
MDDAPDGVIYFSFGSIVKMDSIPARLQNALKEAFSELPQRILWRYNSDVMENQPKNVMIKKWFPQRDILGE